MSKHGQIFDAERKQSFCKVCNHDLLAFQKCQVNQVSCKAHLPAIVFFEQKTNYFNSLFLLTSKF